MPNGTHDISQGTLESWRAANQLKTLEARIIKLEDQVVHLSAAIKHLIEAMKED